VAIAQHQTHALVVLVGLVQIARFPRVYKHVGTVEIALSQIRASVLSNGQEMTVELLSAINRAH
jgi:hypothetical protein